MHIKNLKRGASRGLLSSILLCFLLSGCMVGPNYHKTFFSVPSKWGQRSAQISQHSISLAGWWRQLNDPVLNALMDEAIAGNNDIAIAKARVREARASLGQAVGSLLPSVSNTISGTRSGSGQSDTLSQYRSGFDASWELDFWRA